MRSLKSKKKRLALTFLIISVEIYHWAIYENLLFFKPARIKKILTLLQKILAFSTILQKRSRAYNKEFPYILILFVLYFHGKINSKIRSFTLFYILLLCYFFLFCFVYLHWEKKSIVKNKCSLEARTTFDLTKTISHGKNAFIDTAIRTLNDI